MTYRPEHLPPPGFVEKDDPRPKRLSFLLFFFVLFPLMGLALVATMAFGVPFAFSGACAAASVMFIVWRLSTTYRCTQCQRRLERGADDSIGMMRYRCDECRVLWNIGLPEGGDSPSDGPVT